MNSLMMSNKITNTNVNQAIALLYSCAEESIDELFWESIDEPYRQILEDCYYSVEEGRFTRLEQITNNIKSNRLSYIKIGVQLSQIKLYRIYKVKYSSFKSYCESDIHYPLWRANKLIDAAMVAIKLIKYGFNIIPQNEAQARPLIKLNDQDLIDKWQQVIDNYAPCKITANRIEKIVFGEVKVTKGSLKLPINILREIESKSLEQGLSPEDLISKIFQGEITINCDGSVEKKLKQSSEIVEAPAPELIKKWEKDLHKLAFEERTRVDEFTEDLASELKNTVTDIKLVIKRSFIKSFLQPLLCLHTNSS